MMLYIGSDHGGFVLKQNLCTCLKERGIDYEDLGTRNTESCDYPKFAALVAKKIQLNPQHLGVLICTSGVGMAIAANKFRGIYAARLTQLNEVKIARQHNGINVLCLPGGIATPLACEMIVLFLETSVDMGERHQRRRQQIVDFENIL